MRVAQPVERPLTFDGAGETWRLDTLNDQSYQTVVTWPGRAGEIQAVLVGSDVREVQTTAAHEARVSAALEAFEPGG